MRFLPAVLIAGLLMVPASGDPDRSAADVVERFHGALLRTMQAAHQDDREVIITAAVQAGFNLPTIARIALGRHWRQLEPEQQDTFQELLLELITSTYASRFNHYTGQSFVTLDEEVITTDRMRVRTTLQTSTESVSLDYQLQLTDAGWRIYDIVANGVSDLALKRSNYAVMLADGGLERVKQDIRRSIAANRAGSGTD